MFITQILFITKRIPRGALTGWRWGVGLAGGIISLMVLLGASTAVLADALVQGYKADAKLQIGQVVALDQADSNKVVVAPAKQPSRIYGVIVDASRVPITIGQVGASATYVATGGAYPVLTSDINGPVKHGDYLTLSNLDGIAAKATENQVYVLGRARADFDGRSGVVATTSAGHRLGLVNADISVGKNPLAGSVRVPGALRSAGESIAGKPVSSARLYLALLVFLVTVVAGVSLLYSSIRAAITAMGRNPLSRHAIIVGLYQAIAIGLAIFGLGLFGVYLLLKV